MPNIDLSILNQRQTPAFFADTLANRPAAGFVGRIFISTDTLDLYRDTGSAWLLLSPSSTGTITGSGAAGQVTYFSATSSITGNNNLFYDTALSHLGINTNTPGSALDVHDDQSTLVQLNQTIATNDTRIGFQNSGTALWRIGNFYNAGANDWGIFDVIGSAQQFSIKKTTGQTFIGTQTTTSGRLVVNNATGDNHIVVIGATAPSLRINNSGSGATKQIGIGLATTTNNFIQGSADRDMAIFNGSTTPSPILFGIYGTTNIQEAARISAARNFLIGTTTDAGYKLQVSGSSNFTQTSNAATIEVLRLTNSGAGANTQAKLQFNAAGTNYSSISGGYGSSAPQLTYDVPFGNHVFTGSAISAQCDLGVVGLVATSSRLVINGAIDDGVTALQVTGGAKFSNVVNLAYNVINKIGTQNYLLGSGNINYYYSGSNAFVVVNQQDTAALLYLSNSTGNLLIGTITDAGYKLQVNGTALTNQYRIAPDGTNTLYNIVNDTSAYAGCYVMQAGGGSTGFGGSIALFGHSHATKPGWVEAGISALSGGKFIVNSTANGTGGSVLFIVNQNGQVNIPFTQTFATNALAIAGGLVVGDLYKTATGQLQIVY